MASSTAAPAPAASTGFNFASLLPLLELGGNVALMALGQAGVVPAAAASLAATIEGGINPLIQSIQAGSTKTQDAVVAMASLIATLNVLKANTKDPALLTKIDEYLVGAQQGLAGYIAAGQGFDATKFTPVPLIP
jgi:hypothetical protein